MCDQDNTRTMITPIFLELIRSFRVMLKQQERRDASAVAFPVTLLLRSRFAALQRQNSPQMLSVAQPSCITSGRTSGHESLISSQEKKRSWETGSSRFSAQEHLKGRLFYSQRCPLIENLRLRTLLRRVLDDDVVNRSAPGHHPVRERNTIAPAHTNTAHAWAQPRQLSCSR